MKSLFPELDEVARARDILRNLYVNDPRAWFVAYSGGKDSTLLLQLVFEVAKECFNGKQILVAFNNTLVETQGKLERIAKVFERVERNTIGIKTKILTPILQESAFTWIVGGGYPAPRNNCRWCTDNLKVKPSFRCENELARTYNGLISLNGTRKQESSKRAKFLTLRGSPEKLTVVRKRLNISGTSPLADVKIDELWAYLKGLKTFAWGEDVQELLDVYEGNETTAQRDGCWICTCCTEKRFTGNTTTEQDEIRRFLRRINDDTNCRCVCKTERQRELLNSGKAAGYFTMEARQAFLDFVQERERKTGTRFISDEELEHIKELWRQGKNARSAF